nr:MAG TPA: hypothetical protein [Caudoviricetes sp.]
MYFGMNYIHILIHTCRGLTGFGQFARLLQALKKILALMMHWHRACFPMDWLHIFCLAKMIQWQASLFKDIRNLFLRLERGNLLNGKIFYRRMGALAYDGTNICRSNADSGSHLEARERR